MSVIVPERRLQQARETLPHDYQFGDGRLRIGETGFVKPCLSDDPTRPSSLDRHRHLQVLEAILMDVDPNPNDWDV